jgi:nicotinamidase-related amidase
MKIPNSNRKKALILVDIQPVFIIEQNKYIISNIKDLINHVKYDLYIEAVFHAEEGSIWDRQAKVKFPKDKDFHTHNELLELLKNKLTVHVEKSTSSVLKGSPNVLEILKKNSIEEVHVTGLKTNACVLSTAFDTYDHGYFTYVIEECCESNIPELHNSAIAVLRRQNLTNNSCIEEISFQAV